MKLKLADKLEDFTSLKKDDIVIVKWTDFYVKHHEGSKKVQSYNIYENKTRCNEIICKLKGNHYFNYMMYLGLDTVGINTSQAMEVYIIYKE